jgi:hypothetical protein
LKRWRAINVERATQDEFPRLIETSPGRNVAGEQQQTEWRSGRQDVVLGVPHVATRRRSPLKAPATGQESLLCAPSEVVAVTPNTRLRRSAGPVSYLRGCHFSVPCILDAFKTTRIVPATIVAQRLLGLTFRDFRSAVLRNLKPTFQLANARGSLRRRGKSQQAHDQPAYPFHDRQTLAQEICQEIRKKKLSGDLENWTRGDMRNWTPSD